MRINKFIALHAGVSRRAADMAIQQGRVRVNGQPAQTGQEVTEDDQIALDGAALQTQNQTQTIMLNKPAGYVVSRIGQGNKTVYDLLPPELHRLKPVGRLDKDSSGLLILTNDGGLANRLTHPRYQKEKTYQVALDKPLSADHRRQIQQGIKLEDGASNLKLEPMGTAARTWRIKISEGRNRQIRRTFAALDYKVKKLHRTQFGGYALHKLTAGHWSDI